MTDSQLSKFLALVLRHQPEKLGLTLDGQGWVPVDDLLQQLHASGLMVKRQDLERVVAADGKQRYALRGDCIRANQGHSLTGVCAVELVPLPPPERLYHGTTRERWGKIRSSEGLIPGQRHHVHLSADVQTARQVGSRHRLETLQILLVRAQDYAAQGGQFFLSANGVWLSDAVPLQYLEELSP